MKNNMMKKILVISLISLSIFAQNQDKKDPFKNKGFFNITKFTHYLVNSANLDYFDPNVGIERINVKTSESNGNGLQTINGFFLNPHFSVGVGIGLERFNSPNANTFPLFVDARYYLEDDYNSFYGFANAGGLLKIDNSFNSGMLIGAGIGYKFFINSKKTIAFTTDVGYYHRSIKVPFVNNPVESDLIMNGFMFSIGTIF